MTAVKENWKQAKIVFKNYLNSYFKILTIELFKTSKNIMKIDVVLLFYGLDIKGYLTI